MRPFYFLIEASLDNALTYPSRARTMARAAYNVAVQVRRPDLAYRAITLLAALDGRTFRTHGVGET